MSVKILPKRNYVTVRRCHKGKTASGVLLPDTDSTATYVVVDVSVDCDMKVEPGQEVALDAHPQASLALWGGEKDLYVVPESSILGLVQRVTST